MDINKEALKEKASKDLGEALEELKGLLPEGSSQRDDIHQMIARNNDIENSDKLYEILKTSYIAGGEVVNESRIRGRILEFYSTEKNKLRRAFFAFIQ